MKRFLILLGIVCAISASEPKTPQPEGFIPFGRLLVTPERYDGKQVMVYAHVVIGFEVQGAFATKSSATHPSNGVWLESDLTRYHRDTEAWYQGRVYGVFRAGKGGHMSLWSGSIEVERIDLDPLAP